MQLAIVDVDELYNAISKNKKQLEKLNKTINWEMFRPTLTKAVCKDMSRGGRPRFDVVLMFKIIILGMTEPITSFTGRVIAIVHRENDVEDKLVVAPEGCEFNQAEVAAEVHFQEQFYQSTIDCLWRKSAGMIVFRQYVDVVRYLLLFQSESQTWSFPKGHMEAGETEEQTAIREVREEIGQDLTPFPNFRATRSYGLKQGARKTVVLFLAEVSGEVAVQESEIAEYRWVTAKEAVALLPHGDYAEILAKAERRIAE